LDPKGSGFRGSGFTVVERGEVLQKGAKVVKVWREGDQGGGENLKGGKPET
jgi:hypothetical protein